MCIFLLHLDIYKSFNGALCPFILLRIIVPSERIDLNLSPDKYTQNVLGLEKLIFAIVKQSILKMNEECIQSQRSANESFSATQLKDSSQNTTKKDSAINKRPSDDLDRTMTKVPTLKTPNRSPITQTYLNNNNNTPNELNMHLKGFGVDLSPESPETNTEVITKVTTKQRRARNSSKTPKKSFQDIVRCINQSGKKKLNLDESEVSYTELKMKDEPMHHLEQPLNDVEIMSNDKENNQIDGQTFSSNNNIQNNNALDDEINNIEHVNDLQMNGLSIESQPNNDKQTTTINEPLSTNSKIIEVDLSIEDDAGEMSDNSIDELLLNHLNGKNFDLFELDEPKSPDFEAASYSSDIDIDRIKSSFKNSIKIDQRSCERSRFDVKFSLSQDDKAEEELRRKLNKTDYEKMKIIGQFNKGFIIAELDGDVFIIDQHAADERYNFENVCKELVLQPLKCVQPIPLELTAHDENIIIDNLEVFEKNGFRFLINKETVIGKRIKLDAVPLSNQQVYNRADLEEIIDSVIQMENLPSDYRPTNVKKMLGYQACRKSIMIGDEIGESKMKAVLNNLVTCKHPNICAHGRPVLRVLFNINNFQFPKLN